MNTPQPVTFSYELMTSRNLGFVSAAEQARLRASAVLVTGVGGMGGAAVMCLARTGIGRIFLADIDTFELSNLNRQLVATLETLGQDKAEATVKAIRSINPECEVVNLGPAWLQKLDEVLPQVHVVINGCDDACATITLMRQAKLHGKTVVDAFASPLPNVYVVGPSDPRPEETFGYPTVGMPTESLSPAVGPDCLARELEWVMIHSSSAEHVELDLAAELLAGKRKRFSFAPMVWSTGCLMSYEAIRVMLGKKGGPGPKGLFINPWTHRVERPHGWLLTQVRRWLVRRFMKKLAASAQA